MSEQLARFAALVAAGDGCDLGRAALEIARVAYPDLDPAPSLQQLDALADGVRSSLAHARSSEEAVMTTAAYLFDECGFHGNEAEYYDPRNSFLNDVLARRTGIPITLSVVLIETCARLDLRVDGVGFPGHFLVRVAGRRGPVFLDPFFGGRVIGRDEMLGRLRAFSASGGGPAGSDLQRVLPQALQTTSTPGILARMLTNLLRIYLDREDHLPALSCVELLLVLSPDAPEHVRVRGLLYEQLECLASALRDFQRYLELAPEASRAPEVREHLARLSRVVATVH